MTDTKQNEQYWRLLVVSLKIIAESKGITQEQIAEATGLKQSNVSRIFSTKYSPSLHNFIAIARAVGVNFFFEDRDGTTDLNRIFEKAMEELGRRPDKLPKN